MWRYHSSGVKAYVGPSFTNSFIAHTDPLLSSLIPCSTFLQYRTFDGSVSLLIFAPQCEKDASAFFVFWVLPKASQRRNMSGSRTPLGKVAILDFNASVKWFWVPIICIKNAFSTQLYPAVSSTVAFWLWLRLLVVPSCRLQTIYSTIYL